MKELWRMQETYGKPSVKLEVFKVVKETEKQYHVEDNPGGTSHRVAKPRIDTIPTLFGSGGEWFSDRDKAIDSWEKTYMDRIKRDNLILADVADLRVQKARGKKKK